MAQDKLSGALDAYQQSLAILKRLAGQDESNAGSQKNLSLGYEMVGDVLAAQGKLAEALDAYRQDLAIMKRLAEQDKSNTVWQQDLGGSYEKVGDALLAQGKLLEALDDYRKALAISDTLASGDPSNAEWQNNAAWTRYCVAKVLMQIKDGDRNEANGLVAEGIEIIKRREHQGALDRDAQDTLDKLNEIANALASSSRR